MRESLSQFSGLRASCPAPMQKPRPIRAFTLIEMLLAIAIALGVVVLAVPNMRGVGRDKKLREAFEKFDNFSRRGQQLAVSQQRPWTLTWDGSRILLQPVEMTPEENKAGTVEHSEELPILEGESYSLDRHAALLPAKETPPVWTFWRSGTCEPVIVGYSGPDGTWTAQYNPLTGRGEIIDQAVQ